jgi:HD-GYP domain-containing protein (c-di-GMP phosphodiesterase class II)
MASVAGRSDPFDPILEEQLTSSRTRRHAGVRGREAVGRGSIFLVYVLAASAFAALVGSSRHVPGWVDLAFVAAYAAVSLVEFEVGSGVALPTELVLVPMLFVLPAPHVPLVVGAALLVNGIVNVVRNRTTPTRAVLYAANALFTLGPAAIFAAAGEPAPGWRGGVVLVAAVGTQFATDLTASAAVEWLALGISPRQLVYPMAVAFLIDALIAPVAYVIAVANAAQPGIIFLPAPLVVLVALYARERRQKIDSTLELSSAYRGTAFLLGDVVEADDAYTGEHSRAVVELVSAVGKRLRLSPRDLRIAEFTALLHDVGKIKIPAAIINKPGPLDAQEWALIQTHTLEGETLLRRIGGLLAEVGTIVRSCHEHWDGQGYPDGLAGIEIPVIARIVCCCDAYNAMTTDRPYRRALTQEVALGELVANRGTQFDPDVVDALLDVVAEVAREPDGSRASRSAPVEPTLAPAHR